MDFDDEPVTLLAWLRAEIASGGAQRVIDSAGLSCAEVAGPVGVDQSTIWRWLHRVRQPRGDAAVRFARLLRTLDKRVAA